MRAASIDAIAQAQQDNSGIHLKSAGIAIIHLSPLGLFALCALCALEKLNHSKTTVNGTRCPIK